MSFGPVKILVHVAYGGYALFVWCVGVTTSNVHRNWDCIFRHFLLSITFKKSVVSCRYDSFFSTLRVFFRRQIHKRVRISLVEVYERVGTYVIWASKRGTKGLTDEFMALQSRKNVPFL